MSAPSPAMSDIRAKIAAMLWKFAQPDDRFPDPPEVFFGMADGLIRYLALEPHDEHYNVGYQRYITGWIK